MKITRFEIEQRMNPFIGNLNISGLSGEDKLSLVNLKLDLTKEAKEIGSFRFNTEEGLEGIERYKELFIIESKGELSEAEQTEYAEIRDKISKEYYEKGKDFFNEEVEFNFKKISKKSFETLVKNNDISSIFGYEYIHDLLVDPFN